MHTEYLRIHIRADSNLDDDQNVKYAVRDAVVSYLTPFIAECDTFSKAKTLLTQHLESIERVANGVLEENGFSYHAKASVKNELFPTRVYGRLQLASGFYDALIISLGSGQGNNWWCVAYPPLCFTGEEGGSFKYKSKIAEIISEWRKTYF